MESLKSAVMERGVSGVRLLASVAALTLAFVTLTGCGGGGGQSDEDAVRGVLNQELDAFRKQDARALYNLYSPEARSACPWSADIGAEIEGSMASEIGGLSIAERIEIQNSNNESLNLTIEDVELEYADANIQFDGDSAEVSFTLNVTVGKVEGSVENAWAYQKIDGRWYPENPEGCGGSSGESGSGESSDGSDESAVRDLLSAEVEAFRTADWQALYNMLPPDARAECAYSGGSFTSQYAARSAMGIDDSSELAVTDVTVKIDGDTAQAAYAVVQEDIAGDSHVVLALGASASDPEVFQKIDGEWYAIDAMVSAESHDFFCSPAQRPATPRPATRAATPTAQATQSASAAATATARAGAPTVLVMLLPDLRILVNDSPYGISSGATALPAEPIAPGSIFQRVGFQVSLGKPVTIALSNQADDEQPHTLTVYEDAAYTIPVIGASTGAVETNGEGRFTVTFAKPGTYYFRDDRSDYAPDWIHGRIVVE